MEAAKRFSCEKCTDTFTTNSALKRHVQLRRCQVLKEEDRKGLEVIENVGISNNDTFQRMLSKINNTTYQIEAHKRYLLDLKQENKDIREKLDKYENYILEMNANFYDVFLKVKKGELTQSAFEQKLVEIAREIAKTAYDHMFTSESLEEEKIKKIFNLFFSRAIRCLAK